MRIPERAKEKRLAYKSETEKILEVCERLFEYVKEELP